MDTIESLRLWSAEISRSARSIELENYPYVDEHISAVVAGNRAVAEALTKGADELESLRRQLAEANAIIAEAKSALPPGTEGPGIVGGILHLVEQLAEATSTAQTVVQAMEDSLKATQDALDAAGAPGDSSIAVVDRIGQWGEQLFEANATITRLRFEVVATTSRASQRESIAEELEVTKDLFARAKESAAHAQNQAENFRTLWLAARDTAERLSGAAVKAGGAP